MCADGVRPYGASAVGSGCGAGSGSGTAAANGSEAAESAWAAGAAEAAETWAGAVWGGSGCAILPKFPVTFPVLPVSWGLVPALSLDLDFEPRLGRAPALDLNGLRPREGSGEEMMSSHAVTSADGAGGASSGTGGATGKPAGGEAGEAAGAENGETGSALRISCSEDCPSGTGCPSPGDNGEPVQPGCTNIEAGGAADSTGSTGVE